MQPQGLPPPRFESVTREAALLPPLQTPVNNNIDCTCSPDKGKSGLTGSELMRFLLLFEIQIIPVYRIK
jgi:hypothetical protein